MIVRGLISVFGKLRYLLLALLIAFVVFVLATWFPNLDLVVNILGASDISLADKAMVLISLVGSIATNFSLFSASYTIVIAVLFGMNIALLVFFLRWKVGEVKQRGAATGFLGLVSGVLGIGCAACGSFVATSVLAFFGASGVLLFLPFGGSEFGVLGVVLLLISVASVAQHIGSPSVCKIN